ncbi:Sodium channel protein Nach, partial [Gryllus bimaculatus]
ALASCRSVLWAVAMVGACVGSLLLCLETWERYQESPVVMSLESSYINWKYFLPSVIVCPENKSDSLSTISVAQRLMGSGSLGAAAEQERVQSFLEALADSTSYSTAGFLNEFQNNTEGLPKPKDWLELALQVRWNFTSISPTSKIESVFEVGFCFATNSQVAHFTAVNISLRDDTPPRPLVKSAYSAEETLRDFGFNSGFSDVYSLPRPGLATARVGPLMRVEVVLEVSQVYATSALEELTVKQRRCRFADEVVPDSPRATYSYDVCLEACRARLAQRFCNCRPFFINFKIIMWLRNRTSGKLMNCNCYPACDLYMYRQLDKEVTHTASTYFPPRYDVSTRIYKRTRIKRDVLFSIIDLAAETVRLHRTERDSHTTAASAAAPDDDDDDDEMIYQC